MVHITPPERLSGRRGYRRRMTIVVRPCADGDDLQPYGTGFGPDVDAPRRRRTLVAVDGGIVLGAASALWSSRHPDVVHGELMVVESRRRNGIGTQLLRELQDLAGEGLEFALSVGSPEEGFLRQQGFTPVVDSRVVRLQAGAATLAACDADPPSDVTVEPTELNGEVEAAFEQMYARAHTWAGRYVPTPDRPWIRFAGEPIEGTTFVARRRGRIVAAACLTTGEFAEGADAFLPPTATLLEPGDPAGQAALRAVISGSLRAGATAGVHRVNVEYDTPYTELAALMAMLPTTPVSHHAVWMQRARITIVDPASPEARWALNEYFTELDRRFVDGFDVAGALAEPADALGAPNGLFALALDGNEVVACGGVVFLDGTTGEIKRMWVHPSHRGRGLAGRLLRWLETQIVDSGRRRVVLDTNGVLAEAIAMYGRHGYEPIERYNDNPYAQHWFRKQL